MKPVETVMRGSETLKIYVDGCAPNPRDRGDMLSVITSFDSGGYGDRMDSLGIWAYLQDVASELDTTFDATLAAVRLMLERAAENSGYSSAAIEAEVAAEKALILRTLHNNALVVPLRRLPGHETAVKWLDDFDDCDACIYVTFAALRANFGETVDVETVGRQLLSDELEIYHQWANGEVYGFVLEDENGEELDACWGFYGADWRTNGMTDYLGEAFQEWRVAA